MKKLFHQGKLQYIMLAIIILGMIIKFLLFDFQYIDYGFYLSRWIEEIKANGYLKALKEPFYNYTPTYMYILVLVAKLDLYPLYALKIVSVAFEYVLAFFVGRLAYLHWRKGIVMWIAFAVVPLIPTVLLNSAFMSQCDALYVSFVAGSVYFLLTKRQISAMLFLGVAFSLKMQTAIILPFYFVYMLRGHIRWYKFLIVPVVYFVSVIPAWIAGRPLMDLLTVYIGQAGYNTELVKNFPNLYVWIGNSIGGNAKFVGIVLVFALTLLAGYVLSKKKYAFTYELWIKLILLSAIVCPFLLPGMLERYMYLGDIFATLCAIMSRRYIIPAIGVICVSFYSYVRAIYIFSFSGDALYPSRPFAIFEAIPWEVVSVVYLAIIGFVFYDFVKTLNADKSKEEYISISV